MLLPPLLIFFPGIIPSQRDGSFGFNSIFHFDSMSSRFQKSEEGTNFRHSVQGKNLSPCIWKGNFGNRPHDDRFSRWFTTPSGMLKRGSRTQKNEVVGWTLSQCPHNTIFGFRSRSINVGIGMGLLWKSVVADLIYDFPYITPRATCRSPHGGRR